MLLIQAVLLLKMLKDLKQQTSIAEIETDEYTCPLCGHECKEIARMIQSSLRLQNGR